MFSYSYFHQIALEGDLYEEADPTATGTDSTSGMDSGRDTLQIARGIRTRVSNFTFFQLFIVLNSNRFNQTLRLVARCRSLFSLIAGGSAGSFWEKSLGFHALLMIYGLSDANLAIMEGEWGRCVDHLQVR